ncbi:hypothetical protein HZA45_03165, partial [Candidatus Peregrinibacteria bacterium]|nr:hypothetical protein [Candidatus Peregrinibacteria bacterium]
MAKKKKVAKKKVLRKAKKPVKKVMKKAAKKVLKKAKKFAKKIVKKVEKKAPKVAVKPAAKEAKKPAPAAKTPVKIAPMKKIPPRGAYEMDVEKEILPTVHPHLLPPAGRVPAGFKDLPADLQPRKVSDERAYLVPDEGLSHVPSLIEMQLESYKWFLTEGLKELLEEITPITDFSGKKLELRILGHTFDPAKYEPETCRRRNLTYEAAMKGHVQLINKETGEIKEQDVFLGSIPLMTDSGTFIIGGIERVVVHQLVRSPGVFFSSMPDYPKYHAAKIIPKRGVWLEVETDRRGIISCKIDRKRKIPITQLLRVFGYQTDDQIRGLFSDVTEEEHDFIEATLKKDTATTLEDAYQSIYRRIRPGDYATPENAKQLIDSLFFDFKKYDMGSIARYKLNRRFGVETPSDEAHRVFQVVDFVEILRELVRLNYGKGVADDIDHLSNRRVRSVGELVQNKYRVGLVRTERIVKDRMTVMDLETVTPTQLINCRPITAAMREFYASSQLSQFMDQTNPLAELAHKRRLSAMGPGGLSRERASFDVRDVHPSHYGRICPIATPEGPNIGLVVHLAGFARVNSYGFLETPYKEVKRTVSLDADKLAGRMIDEPVKDGRKIFAKEGDKVETKEMAKKIVSLLKAEGKSEVSVRAYATGKVTYMDAEQERRLTIAQAQDAMTFSEFGEFLTTRVSARKGSEPTLAHVRDVTHIDVSPKQILSVTTALIPFLEHDDNTRASMGTNMQRQSVPLIKPHAPLVGTGLEGLAARASGHAHLAEEDGEVTYVDADQISIVYRTGRKQTYPMQTFLRSNQGTCFHMRPRVARGDKVRKGECIADGAAVEGGELALEREAAGQVVTGLVGHAVAAG